VYIPKIRMHQNLC